MRVLISHYIISFLLIQLYLLSYDMTNLCLTHVFHVHKWWLIIVFFLLLVTRDHIPLKNQIIINSPTLFNDITENIKQKAQEPHRSPEQQLLYLWSYKHYLHYQNQNILKMSYSRSYTESNNNTDEFYEYIFTRPLFWFYYLWEYFPLFLYLKKFPLCGPTVLQEIMVWQDLIFTACVLTQVSAF